jgi:hypothetical protein
MATLVGTWNAIPDEEREVRPEPSFRSAWENATPFDEPSWRISAFSLISRIENSEAKVVPGLGSFAAYDRAANALRACLRGIRESALPLPNVTQATGGVLLLTWTNGKRSVEIVSYPDGEICVDAIERGSSIDAISGRGVESAVSWLVRG